VGKSTVLGDFGKLMKATPIYFDRKIGAMVHA